MSQLAITRTESAVVVRVGRYVESISTLGKSTVELIDAVRWAAITAGVSVSEELVWETLQEEQE